MDAEKVGHTPDLSKMDEKNAKLTLKLRAKSGYSAEAAYPAISANQWSRVLMVCEDGSRAKVMAAAPALLETLIGCSDYFGNLSGMTVDDAQRLYAKVRATITAATEGAHHG